MPCYACGARQVDPVRGPSPWKRGVRGGHQVLVCPGCQQDRDWVADLDRCPQCGSTMLVRRLGETLCRECGPVQPVPEQRPPTPTAPPIGGGLAREVQDAVDRVLGRSPG